MDNSCGRLIIVPTPIGNLGDMTIRAKEALAQADVVCAEDTRITGKLLNAYGIKARLERLDENLIGTNARRIVDRVAAGQVIAYCSDAGMPGVSDPGLRLVAAARESGVPVEVLPGANAVCTAYVASGCTNPRFYFGGFFPRKAQERTRVLESLRSLDAALIFYESPNRVADALGAIAQVFPYRRVAVCRELTKLHEEIFCSQTGEAAQEFARRRDAGEIRGEFVLVIDAAPESETEEGQARASQGAAELAATLAAEGLSRKDISKRLMAEFGISRNEAYDLALGK